MAELKTRIRAARNALGWTQSQLAEAADISLSFVSLLERGERTDLPAMMARDVARALGCSIDWLLTGEGAAPKGIAA